MARGEEMTRLSGGRRGGRTSHANSNVEGTSNVDIAASSNANIPSLKETANGISSQAPNHKIVADNDAKANHVTIQDASTIEERLLSQFEWIISLTT